MSTRSSSTRYLHTAKCPWPAARCSDPAVHSTTASTASVTLPCPPASIVATPANWTTQTSQIARKPQPKTELGLGRRLAAFVRLKRGRSPSDAVSRSSSCSGRRGTGLRGGRRPLRGGGGRSGAMAIGFRERQSTRRLPKVLGSEERKDIAIQFFYYKEHHPPLNRSTIPQIDRLDVKLAKLCHPDP